MRLHATFALLVFASLGMSALSTVQAEEQACPGLLLPLTRDNIHTVVRPGQPNNLRAEPSVDADLLGTMDPGEIIIAFNDTACADGYLWRNVVDDGIEGWTVEADTDTYFLEPWVEPEPVPVSTPDGDLTRVETDLLSFEYASDLAETVVMSDQPGYSYREAMSPQPGYRFYEIGHYDAEGEFDRIGHITIYHTQDWTTEIGGWAEGTIWRLRNLLDRRPELPEYDGETGEMLSIPVIPSQNAAQEIVAQPDYLSFENGTGVRFIAYYTQMTGQIFSGGFEYFFQGLTDDGEYQISARLNLSIPNDLLPAFDDQTFIAEYEDPSQPGTYYKEYLSEVTSALNSLEDDAFSPDLSALDAMFRSMHLGPTE